MHSRNENNRNLLIMLKTLGLYLLRFFKAPVPPITVKEIADEFDLHKSEFNKKQKGDDQERHGNPQFEHAWKYFSFHADQRMKVFNFFMILSAFTFAGIVQCLRSSEYSLLAILLCLIEGFNSVIFYKLDVRHRTFIEVGEYCMQELEKFSSLSAHMPFLLEDKFTEQIKSKSPKFFVFGYFTCSSALSAVYRIFGAGSFALIVFIIIAHFSFNNEMPDNENDKIKYALIGYPTSQVEDHENQELKRLFIEHLQSIVESYESLTNDIARVNKSSCTN